jgi:hypothetical protein
MKKIAILLFLCAVITGGANAQIQFSAGPGAGFNCAVHVPESGNAIATHFGVSVTSQFDMQFSRRLGLLVWVDFNDLSARQTRDGVTGKSKIHYLHLVPTLKFCFPTSPFYLFAGPGAGLRTAGRVETGYASFGIPDMNVRFEARLGVGYDIFLSRKFTLSPFAVFNAGLNDVAQDADWQIHTFQSGLVLRFNAF